MRLGLSLGLSATQRGASAPAFSPTDISGLVWWLRADLGVTLDGSTLVQTWADQSGVGDSTRNATDDGGTWTRPGFTASDASYNNRPTIGPWTASANTRLRTGAAWSATYSTYTLIVVGHAPATSTRYFLIPSGVSYASIVNEVDVAHAYAGTTPLEVSGSPKTLSSPTYALAEFNFSAGANGKIFVGQTSAADGTLDISAEPVALGAAGMYIGGYPAGSDIFAPTSIAEIIAYNKILSAPEKAQIASYMGRYGF